MQLRPIASRLTTAMACLAVGLAAGCGGDDEPVAARPDASPATVTGGAVPPEGPGTEQDELLEPGATVTLGGLRYTPVLSRQLNPSLRPDQAILEGVDVDRTGGPLLVAVFLRVCNEEGGARTPTADFVLKDAFGNRVKPVELPADNALAYRPGKLSAGQCAPEEGSVPDATLEGGALVFRVSLEVRRNTPLGLEISSPSGRRQTVGIDL